ncbi:uncharacterized protein LOC110651270 isoform X2 [Hevea brasiliensis]|nr:uncharacterized protein LOC110651270 isoform X2 [Hevea brasiliensis]XP_021662237.2 uncharacterized protein LOC110651270 isoform X2 [Hevea brasiliensis]
MQGIKMGQLEHIQNKLHSSVQMGIMGPGINDPALQEMAMMGLGSTDTQSLQISVSSNQAQPLENVNMADNCVLQKFSVSNMQMGQMDPQAYSLVSKLFLSPSKQLGEMEAMLSSVGSQQPSMLSKRKAPVEPTFSNPGLQKLSMPNKRVAQIENRPWLQKMSAPNKLPVQMQSQSISNNSGLQRSQAPSKRSTSTKAGLQQLPVQKNQSGQRSPMLQNVSSNSVRSKLRESLAAALALVSRRQDKASSSSKNSNNEDASTAGPILENSQPSENASGTADVSEEHKGSLPTKMDPLAQKSNDGEHTSQEISSSTGDSTETSKNDGQTFQSTIGLHDEDASFSDNFLVKDELLQGNGLSWVLEPDMRVEEKKDVGTAQKQPDPEVFCRNSGDQVALSPQVLASKIEAELYKLFGGVNKKYKEKGRSLLFNLKDHNNPELRERVMSGEIPPEKLCSMTAEELASKELSQWRMAKAEELAQMVVLRNSDIDMRRLVKKTHKGEFQVEVEPEDSVSVEVAVGASSLTRMQPKPKQDISLPSKPDQMQAKGNAVSEKSCSEDQNVLMIASSEGTDLMQRLMVDDELKDAEFLPPIVSLDEFMESLNSEPPFENLPVDTGKTTPASEKDDSQVVSKSKSPDATLRDLDDITSGKPDLTDVKNTKLDADGQSTGCLVKSEAAPSLAMPKGEHVWEGLLQLNISLTASVIGIFKSGEKTSAKDWSGFIEIKGRVRLNAFEKFLQELPMSRSRAVMVLHFVCKEGSADSERAGFSEVSDSYVMDGRVGFAEPASGVELYFCPPLSKTSELLAKVLPKDQIDALNAIDNGLIGVIVWRKPQITSTMSPNSASPHKHNSKKQHSFSRRRQEKDANVNVNLTPKQTLPSNGPTTYTRVEPDDDDDDDVPPGFGPPAARDEDDLPEFNFSSGSVTSGPQSTTYSVTRGQGMPPFQPHLQTPSRPVDQMRELVQRYGLPKSSAPSGNWQDNRTIGVAVRPWNDDDDDMPEWHPEENKPQLQPVHMHDVQPPILRAHMMQQITTPQMASQPVSLRPPQMNVIHGPQHTAPSWQQGPRTVPTPGSHNFGAYQSNYRASPGLEAGLQGMARRGDAPKSWGF